MTTNTHRSLMTAAGATGPAPAVRTPRGRAAQAIQGARAARAARATEKARATARAHAVALQERAAALLADTTPAQGRRDAAHLFGENLTHLFGENPTGTAPTTPYGS
ncbi:hypothetical protein AB0A66_17850 [Streptomyces longwoodensis]|uniref:hypothetical protein n=1 Tax=Streptomyces longwoodensis TaxID=68231 RepID=UPI00340E2F6D